MSEPVEDNETATIGSRFFAAMVLAVVFPALVMVLVFLLLSAGEKEESETALFNLAYSQVEELFQQGLDPASPRLQHYLSDVAAIDDISGVTLSGSRGDLSYGDPTTSTVRSKKLANAGGWLLSLYYPSVFDRYLSYLLYLFVFLLLSIVSVFVISRIYVQRTQIPLRRIIEQLSEIDGKDPNQQVDVACSAEHESLLKHINQLIARSGKQYQYLELASVKVSRSSEQMKVLVRERTDALEQTASILRRREQFLQKYAQVITLDEVLDHRIARLLKLCCDMLGMPHAQLLYRKDGNTGLVMQMPAGKRFAIAGNDFLQAVMQSLQPSYSNGHGDVRPKNFPITNEVPVFAAFPLMYLGKAELLLLLSGSSASDILFVEDDVSLVNLCSQWIGASLSQLDQAKALHREKERAHVTLESITDAVITTDAKGCIDYINPVGEVLIGRLNEDVVGMPSNEALTFINDITNMEMDNPVKYCIDKAKVVIYTENIAIRHIDGDDTGVECSLAPLMGASGDVDGCVVIMHDVSQARELSRQLSYNATHDALTGLVNRREFERRLKHALDSARGKDQYHALLYLDLDQFKIVNDTCGHTAGDHLLQQLTAEMQSQISVDDTLARLGGDEFGVLLQRTTQDDAMQVADNIRQAVKDYRFVWRGRSFDVGVSIGLVGIETDVGRLAEVMSAADTACYAAKTQGRNRVHLFQADDEEVNRHRGQMEWVVNINNALQENRFLLFKQEIKGLQSDSHNHFEILLRMRHGDGRVIDPGAFIPAAERFDLMPDVDRWVIENVCQYISERYINGAEPPVYAINLSGASIDENKTHDFIIKTFDKYNIDPHKICFEITETTAISNLAQAIKLISALKKIGCKFSLDDFGAGVSTFSYLKSLPVDYLKIDGSFVQNLVQDKVDQSMVKAVNEIAHIMNLKTIAEYVETEEIQNLLTDIGVDFAQGYWINRPEPLLDS